MPNIETILRTQLHLGKWQTAFVTTLLRLMIALPSRATFRNMARFASMHERTFTRHFDQHLDWLQLNLALAQPSTEVILAVDASFLPKSGRHTYGLDVFWNGCRSRHERGLEVSLLALIEPTSKRAFALSAAQTPPRQAVADTPSRIEAYLAQLRAAVPDLPAHLRYLVADGYYAKKTFVDGVRDVDLHMVGKLRRDANLRYLYRGARTGKPGRPKQYDGKVDLDDPSSFDLVGELEPGVQLYSAVVNHVRFKRSIRLAYLLDERVADHPRRALLFSSDVAMGAHEVVRLYRLRFQIEFLFRDAKQYTGLGDAQTRSKVRLAYHFNASFTALNLARAQDYARQDEVETSESAEAVCRVFSMASAKQRGFNRLYLRRIIGELELGAERVLNHPSYERLCSFGAIAA